MKNEKLIFIMLIVLIFISSVAVMMLVGQNRDMNDIITHEKGIKLGTKAFIIHAQSIDGTPIDIKEKNTLLVFFKTTCPGCQEDIPLIQKNLQSLIENGIMVVGISSDPEYAIQRTIKNYNLTFPIIRDVKQHIIFKYKNKIFLNLVYINSEGQIKYSRHIKKEHSIKDAITEILSIKKNQEEQ